jgi:hypothetical protein
MGTALTGYRSLGASGLRVSPIGEERKKVPLCVDQGVGLVPY